METQEASKDLAAVAAELRNVLGQLKRRLRDHGQWGDLTYSQTSALSRLDREGPSTVSALAKAEGIRPQSMGANIAALEAAGLVTGSPDPKDGRQTIMSITEHCREWVRLSRASKEDWLARTIQTELAPGVLAQLARGVELLKRIANS
jgi:DNA-binding MarR family transcriptional regulator